MDRWQIRLLGGFQLERSGYGIGRFRTLKTGRLLAYLAYHAGVEHPREALAERFWPDSDPDDARLSLNTAIHSLRKQLEPPGVPRGGVLTGDRLRVSINPDAIFVDARAFLDEARWCENHAESDSWRERARGALGHYRGELLPGFSDDWVETERHYLATVHVSLLRDLALALARDGIRGEAIELASRAYEADPLDARSCLASMECLARAGDLPGARSVWQRYRRTLQRALGVEPDDPTRDAARLALLSARLEPSLRVQPTSTEPNDAIPPPNRLPIQFTRFFGRQEESDQVAELLLGRDRHVTLTGVGGSGKTRLAVEIGHRLAHEFPGGVWFVPLADLQDDLLVTVHIRDALGLPRSTLEDPIDQVCGSISGPTLLILDNLEQLPSVGAEAILPLLSRAPGLRCLATSRRRTNVAGEREVVVGALPIPDGEGLDPEILLSVPSVSLFVDRARAAQPDFRLDPRNGPSVASVCRTLEGIPLAIELAAARIGTIGLSKMVRDLTSLPRLVAPRKSGKEPRHHSLEAALKWSYDLLGPDLQRTLGALSVFRGSWSSESAASICDLPMSEIHDVLSRLRGHSLVISEDTARGLRSRMLEVVRQFSFETLSPEVRHDLANRHAQHFLALAETALPELEGPRQTEWLDLLEVEVENLRATADHLVATRDGEGGARLVAALWRYWHSRGRLAEGLAVSRSLLALPGADQPSIATGHALNGVGTILYAIGDLDESRVWYERALQVRRAIGDHERLPGTLNNLSNVLASQGRLAEARSVAESALELRLKAGDHERAAVTLHNLGRIAYLGRDFEAARRRFEEAMAIDVEIDHRPNLAYDICGLGIVDFYEGDYPRAIERLEQASARFREVENRQALPMALTFLALSRHRAHADPSVPDTMSEAIEIARELGIRQRLCQTLEYAAEPLAESNPERAAALLGTAARLRREIGLARPECDRESYERVMAIVREALGEAVFAAAFEGRTG